MKKKVLVLVIVLGTLLSSGNAFNQPDVGKGLQPRKPLKCREVTLKENHSYRISVKFKDEAGARMGQDGKLYLKNQDTLASDAAKQLEEVNKLKDAVKARISPVLKQSVEALEAYRQRNEQQSGVAKPDLAGMFHIDLDNPGDTRQIASIVKLLKSLDVIEFVYVNDLNQKMQSPYDIDPVTPDYVPLQLHRGADPGLNVDYAWSKGAKGQGVRLTDLEFSINVNHEDLMDSNIQIQPGQTLDLTNPSHGTPMLGVSAAGDNGYGVSGIAPDADFWFYPFLDQEFDTCLQAAIMDSDPGDVILIEIAIEYGFGTGPIEMDPVIWSIIEAATDDVIIVEPTGNKDANMDGPDYADWLSWGDSGAIVVTGGTDDKSHKHQDGCYGSRVDVEAWSTNVYTTLSVNASDLQSYGPSNGTSIASALTAGSCTILQSAAELYMGRRLTPYEMRKLLKTSGTRTEEGAVKGRFINLQYAVDSIMMQAGGQYNFPPLIDCGNDVVVYWPTNMAALTATISNEAGEALTNYWMQIGGPAAVSFADQYNPETSVTFPQIGKYVFRFSSTDSIGQSSIDEIEVYVSRSATYGVSGIINAAYTNNDITVNSNYAYICGDGLRIVDLINLNSQPGLWSGGLLYDVEVKGNYAYIVDAVGKVHIVDVQNPASPYQVSDYDPGIMPFCSLAVENNILYLALSWNGIQFIDVTNPSSPAMVKQYSASGKDFRFLKLSGNYLYLYDQGTTEGFVIIDVTDVMNPTQVGALSYAGKNGLDLEVAGNYAYILIEGEGVKVIDISNKANPVQVGAYTTAALKIEHNNGYLYLMHQMETEIVNVSNAAQPVLDSYYAPADIRLNSFPLLCDGICASPDGRRMYLTGTHVCQEDVFSGRLVILNTNDRLDVTSNQAGTQADPVNTGAINFTATFTRNVADFTAADVTVSGTAGGTKTVTVTGSGSQYNVAVTGMTTDGTVIADIPAGGVHDAFENANRASTSTDNTVTWDVTVPVVSDLTSPTSATTGAYPIPVTIVFSEALDPATFTDPDLTVTNGAVQSGSLATSDNITWTVNILPAAAGSVTVYLAAGVCSDPAGNTNDASTTLSRTYIDTVSWGGATAAVDSGNSSITTASLNITDQPDRILLVGISTEKTTAGAIMVSSVFFNSTTPVELAAIPGTMLTYVTGTNSYLSAIYYVVNPPVENKTITVTLSGTPGRAKVDAYWMYNVNTADVLGSHEVGVSAGPVTTISTALTTSSYNSVIIDNISGSSASYTFNADSGQIKRWSLSGNGNMGAGSTKQMGVPDSTTVGWTVSTQNTALLQSAAEIRIIQ